MKYILCALVMLIFAPADALAENYFCVKIGGTKTDGVSATDIESFGWADSDCYGSIRTAIAKMAGGDQVWIDDGTYTGVVNSVSGMPSGTDSDYTVIRARNTFGVTLDTGLNSDPLWDYNARLIKVAGGTSYVEIEGFKCLQRDRTPEEAITLAGSYVKLKKCFLRVESNMNDYLFGIAISSGASYILVEDCALTGGFRYMVGVRCSGGSASNIIFRRVVVRGDWVDSTQPYSCFAVYGHNSSAAMGPHHIYYQNCIVIDGNLIESKSDYKHTPWYIFKGNHDIMLDSCITINNQVAYYYSFRNDFSGYNMEIRNSIFASNTGTTATGVWRGSGTTSGYDRLHGCTFYGQPRGFTWSGTTSKGHIKNNLFVDLTDGSIAFDSSGVYPSSRKDNSFDNTDQNFGDHIVPYSEDMKYLCRIESYSNRYNAGDGGAHIGAHIIKKIGESGTLYDEPGWDEETTENLWPWPYQDEIKAWFREPNDPPTGASPQTNDTTRGFCESGETLTHYIWNYLGNGSPYEVVAANSILAESGGGGGGGGGGCFIGSCSPFRLGKKAK